MNCPAHQNAKARRCQAQTVKPPQLREGRNGQKGDRNGDQRIRQIKLVVMQIQRIVAGLIRQCLQRELVFCDASSFASFSYWAIASCFLISRLSFRGFFGCLQVQLHQRGLGHLLAQISRLVKGSMINFVSLRLSHGPHDVVVLDLADAQEDRQQGDGNSDGRIQV